MKVKEMQTATYEQMKENLVFRVIPEGSIPEGVPYETVCGDIVAICCIELSRNADKSATVTVNNAMMRALDITAEQLFTDTGSNAMKMRPPKVRSMRNAMEEALGVEIHAEDSPLIVAGIEGNVCGAAVIRYPGFLERISRKIGSFYILPSSVHEVLLMPEREAPEARELNEMVRIINRMEVAPSDRLSDQAYHYDAAECRLETATDYERRRGVMGPNNT